MLKGSTLLVIDSCCRSEVPLASHWIDFKSHTVKDILLAMVIHITFTEVGGAEDVRIYVFIYGCVYHCTLYDFLAN